MAENETTVEMVSIHEASTPLCEDAQVLVEAISAGRKFTIGDKTLKYDNKVSYNYQISNWFKVDDRIGFFHIFVFKSNGDITQHQCDLFSEMLRAFKTNLRTLKAVKIETLWDDLSFRYCKLAYPIILDVENRMRKLIAQFMLKTLGDKWLAHTAPKKVTDEISRSERQQDDPSHKVDFSTLISYLTKPYSNSGIDDVYKKIKNIDPNDAERSKEELIELKEMIPESNWKRHFSAIVKCDDKLLIRKWGSLYDLRCKVAHNTYLTKLEFEEVVKLSGELGDIIKNAINEINGLVVTEEQAKDLEVMATQLTESAAISQGLSNATNGGGDSRSIQCRLYKMQGVSAFKTILGIFGTVAEARGLLVFESAPMPEIFDAVVNIGMVGPGEIDILKSSFSKLMSDHTTEQELQNVTVLLSAMSQQMTRRSEIFLPRNAKILDANR
ncbi:hypothetical protein GIY62_00725 [Burkholderia plantarii]|nr:hypothetical protein GIY62_00725 [Burkholderia plantarii]